MLTNLPYVEEVKQTVFSINKDGAPGLYGFGALFFQEYWDIVAADVVNVVTQFFSSG